MDGKFDYKFLAVCAILSLIFGAIGAYAMLQSMQAQPAAEKTKEELISEYYDAETAVSISPSDFVSHLKEGRLDGTMVDLRDKNSYERGHFITAVNIPAGSLSRQELIDSFRALPSDMPIITYCYSSYCMLSRKVGKVLADEGIYTLHLTAGWYEINRDYSDYTLNGSEPGTANATYYPPELCSPTTEEGLGC